LGLSSSSEAGKPPVCDRTTAYGRLLLTTLLKRSLFPDGRLSSLLLNDRISQAVTIMIHPAPHLFKKQPGIIPVMPD
jgi:hypothetical protein